MDRTVAKESTPKNTMSNVESGATLQAHQVGKAMNENANSGEDAPTAYETPDIKEADDSSAMKSVIAATPAIKRLRQSRLEFKVNSPSDALGSPDVNQLMRSKLKNKGPKQGQ